MNGQIVGVMCYTAFVGWANHAKIRSVPSSLVGIVAQPYRQRRGAGGLPWPSQRKFAPSVGRRRTL